MFVQIEGRKVYYETVGGGRPVLLLHGWGVDSSNLRPISGFVRDALHARPIAPDLPGFGLSDAPAEAYGVSDYVRVVAALLDGLRLPSVDVLAHSFGGRVAIKLAAAHPQRVRKLVLVDSAGIRPPRTAAYSLRVRHARLVRSLARIVPGPAGRRLREHLQSNLGSADYRAAGALRPTFVRVVNEDLTPCLREIGCPTLLVWGAADDATPLSSAAIMREQIPGARLVVLRGAGHFCWQDDWAGFASAVAPFLGEAE
jgi:pimeloyl-ACP methyl ester carboxylesterase